VSSKSSSFLSILATCGLSPSCEPRLFDASALHAADARYNTIKPRANYRAIISSGHQLIQMVLYGWTSLNLSTSEALEEL
jgi:hypothetical protein